jgi:hypothetical protein
MFWSVTYMPYREAVEGLIELPEAKGRGWLAVVDEVRTVSAKQLRQLALEAPIKAPDIVLPRTPAVFDVEAARRYFSNSWVPVEVPVEELRAVMPGGVVSRRAWRVGISPLIVDVFEGGMMAKLTSVGEGLCLALAEDGADKRLATISVERKIHVCHCAEFAEKGFCKHLLLATFHFHEAILDRWGKLLSSPTPEEWLESFTLAQQHQHRRTMLCNWLYYFTKECYARLEFKAGKYRFQNSVKKAIRQMEVNA